MLKLSHLLLVAFMSVAVSAEAVTNTEAAQKPEATPKIEAVQKSETTQKIEAAQKLGTVEEGEASYYSDKLHGRKTASGGIYDKTALTAAHHTLKFGTKVKVTYLQTGKSVVVVINDRIPTKTKRTIDLSRAAAEELGLIKAGHGKVTLEIIAP